MRDRIVLDLTAKPGGQLHFRPMFRHVGQAQIALKIPQESCGHPAGFGDIDLAGFTGDECQIQLIKSLVGRVGVIDR